MIRRLDSILIPVAALLTVYAAPIVALASPPHGEGGGEHGEAAGHGAEHGAEHGSEGIVWFSKLLPGGEGGKTGYVILLINFAVLFFVLKRLLFDNLAKANAEKSDAIRLELERATTARAEAEALVAEYEDKLGALEAEVESIRETAKKNAEAEHARILAEAEAQAEKIRLAGIKAGEREAERRRTELENEIVDRALERAEAAIRSSFGIADQRRLIDAWVDEVGNGPQLGQPGGN